MTSPARFTFASAGVEHVGDLYLPHDLSRPVPAVVTAPGFGGVKEMEIPAIAEALASAGIACLAFDYAGFGASGGFPRQHLNPAAQASAFGDALGALGRDPRVDAERLGIWGMSFSGGHTLRVAASHPGIRAAVAVAPFIANRGVPSPWLVASVVADAAGRLLGRPGRTVPVVGAPGTRALMTADGAQEALAVMSADAPTYVNRITTASLPAVARWNNTANAAAVAVPLRVVLGTRDTITPPDLVRRALRGRTGAKARELDVVEIPADHFELVEQRRDEVGLLVVEWFDRHLAVRPPV